MTGPDYANLERHVSEETPRARGYIEGFSEGYSARECPPLPMWRDVARISVALLIIAALLVKALWR